MANLALSITVIGVTIHHGCVFLIGGHKVGLPRAEHGNHLPPRTSAKEKHQLTFFRLISSCNSLATPFLKVFVNPARPVSRHNLQSISQVEVRRCPAPGLYGGYMGFWMFLKK
jgi:hypothetical protein